MSDNRINQIVQIKRAQETDDNPIFAVFVCEWYEPAIKGHTDVCLFDDYGSAGADGWSGVKSDLVQRITRAAAVHAVDAWAKAGIQEFTDKIYKQAMKMLAGDLKAREEEKIE